MGPDALARVARSSGLGSGAGIVTVARARYAERGTAGRSGTNTRDDIVDVMVRAAGFGAGDRRLANPMAGTPSDPAMTGWANSPMAATAALANLYTIPPFRVRSPTASLTGAVSLDEKICRFSRFCPRFHVNGRSCPDRTQNLVVAKGVARETRGRVSPQYIRGGRSAPRSAMAKCAAASRATGTRNGEQET